MSGGKKKSDKPPADPKGLAEATLPDVSAQSEGFRLNRAARRNALIEDYVELIADLLAEGLEARQVDIATRLGVSQPTVAKMLTRLAAEGYVHRRPYRGVFLTEKGRSVADEAKNRHRIVESFLRASASGKRRCVSMQRALSIMSAMKRLRPLTEHSPLASLICLRKDDRPDALAWRSTSTRIRS